MTIEKKKNIYILIKKNIFKIHFIILIYQLHAPDWKVIFPIPPSVIFKKYNYLIHIFYQFLGFIMIPLIQFFAQRLIFLISSWNYMIGYWLYYLTK